MASWLQKAAAQGHKEASESLSKLLIDEGNDPLYDEAVKFVLESRNVSISLVQRHLRIGYNRAARLIDQMELAGIVSPLRSDGGRDVLISLEGKPAVIKKPKGAYIPTARDKFVLIALILLIAAMQPDPYISLYMSLFIAGMVLFSGPLEKIFRSATDRPATPGAGLIGLLMLGVFHVMRGAMWCISQLLDRLINSSAAPRIQIAEKLRNFADVARNHFAGYLPISIPIKRVAVGLTLTAGVLWFFAGMVRDHFFKDQPAPAPAKQVAARQQSPQTPHPQADKVQEAGTEAPVAQDDTPQPIIWSNHSFPGSALAVENRFESAFQPLPPEFARYMGSAFGKVFGQDGPKDFGEAVKWYLLAANQGYAAAQYNLGVMYHYGRGVPEDHKEAEKWYRLAADKGDAAAQYNLKMMRDNGQGVSQDHVDLQADTTQEPPADAALQPEVPTQVVGETPSVSTGWIGVGIRALSSDFIHSMGLAEGQGVLISEVLNAGPAAQAGMAVGDILISVNKKTVGTGNILEVVFSLPVGNVAQFEVLRNDARMLLTVRVGQKP